VSTNQHTPNPDSAATDSVGAQTDPRKDDMSDATPETDPMETSPVFVLVDEVLFGYEHPGYDEDLERLVSFLAANGGAVGITGLGQTQPDTDDDEDEGPFSDEECETCGHCPHMHDDGPCRGYGWEENNTCGCLGFLAAPDDVEGDA
jgi:hypothetical protein